MTITKRIAYLEGKDLSRKVLSGLGKIFFERLFLYKNDLKKINSFKYLVDKVLDDKSLSLYFPQGSGRLWELRHFFDNAFVDAPLRSSFLKDTRPGGAFFINSFFSFPEEFHLYMYKAIQSKKLKTYLDSFQEPLSLALHIYKEEEPEIIDLLRTFIGKKEKERGFKPSSVLYVKDLQENRTRNLVYFSQSYP